MLRVENIREWSISDLPYIGTYTIPGEVYVDGIVTSLCAFEFDAI